MQKNLNTHETDLTVPDRPRIIGGVLCEDFKVRPPWAAIDPLTRRYHDEKWGHSVDHDDEAFEALCFQIFQSGLSLRLVLAKWPALTDAFHDFKIRCVAAMTAKDIDALVADPLLIRNRRKIEAVVTNAKIAAEGIGNIHSLTLLALTYSCEEDYFPLTMLDIPETTPESEALAQRMKELGYTLIGPKLTWQWLQAIGCATTHLQDSWRRLEAA